MVTKKSCTIITMLLLLIVIVASSQVNRKVLIDGEVEVMFPGSKIYFKKQVLGEKRIFVEMDSIVPYPDGKFEFNLNLEPGYYQLFYKDDYRGRRTSTPILYDYGSENIKIKIDTFTFYNNVKMRIKVKGSSDNDLLKEYFDLSKFYYQNHISPTQKQINSLIIKDQQVEEIDKLNESLNDYKNDQRKKLDSIILNRMGTSISIYQTMNTWDNNNFKLIDTIVERFKKNKPNSFITTFIQEKARKMKEVNLINKEAILFTLMNERNEQVALKSFIGKKIILIDFWASWCGPCIAEIPSMKSIYERFKNKLEIISISTDKKNENWHRALNKVYMPWTNLISERETEEVSIAKKYGVKQLPTKFLIDKNGVIIQKDISLVDLEKYLTDTND